MESNFLKRITFLLVIMCGAYCVQAQQLNYINSQWWLQMPLINPAASGLYHDLDVAAGSRLGADNNELGDGTLLFGRIDGRINAINSGIGFSYFNNNPERLSDKTGNYIMRQRFLVNYNYQFHFANESFLAVGASLEMVYNSWNIIWSPILPGNPSIPPPSGVGTDINIGFGLMYGSEKWHLGMSMLPAINMRDDNNLVQPEYMYYFVSAYDITIVEKFSIEPGLMVHAMRNTSAFNLMLKAWYDRAYYAGFGLNRSETQPDSFDMLLGIQLKNGIGFHYAYIYTISDFSNVNPNRNAISINYQLPNN